MSARGELDSNKRREQYGEMQQILYDWDGAVVPVFSSYVLAHADRLAHGPLSGTFDLDTFRVARHFWFNT